MKRMLILMLKVQSKNAMNGFGHLSLWMTHSKEFLERLYQMMDDIQTTK